MKRLESSDSLGALISLCPASEEKGSGGSGSYRSFQSILDGFEDEDCGEESGGPTTEKKRRLSVDQVKALEKNFEVENKLEPERKVKLAQELGLQPRQVAVWFQNRRARWKTKQLEKDYGMLKANYEALKLSYEALQHVNETLVAEVRELKEKREVTWNVRETESQQDIIKEDRLPVKREDGEEQTELTVINSNGSEKNKQQQGYLNGGVSVFNDFKDGSDSDSSAILNDDNSPHGPVSSGIFSLPLAAASSSAARFNCSSSSSSAHITGLQLSESRVSLSDVAHKAYHQFFKMEEHDLLNPDDESCNFFADEQAPTLQWYCSDPWT